jgi:hypothetical protein
MKVNWAGPVVLVAIGTVFLLNNLGFDLPVREVFRGLGRLVANGWPLILIVIGVIQLLSVPLQLARGKRGVLVGPVTLITLGVLFQFQQWDWVPFRSSWPVLLIAMGVAIFLQNLLLSGAAAGRAFRRFGGFGR